MNLKDLSSGQLRRAAAIKDQIDALTTQLDRILGSTSEGASPVRKRRKMSAAAKAKIAAAQRARWAKQRGAGAKATAKPRRKMSAAVCKRLAQLAKARWAKAKAAGRKTL